MQKKYMHFAFKFKDSVGCVDHSYAYNWDKFYKSAKNRRHLIFA